MRRADLTKMTVPQLVERFMELALGQYQAELYDEIAKFNRLYDGIVAVKDELKARSGDQRSALVALFGHPNPQVRLTSAQWALAVAPEGARRTLQKIWDRKEFPQAADARLTLTRLDDGTSGLI